MLNAEFWKGKRVFVTGHTGFKGSWLTLLLHGLGAEVVGYGLPPESADGLFAVARVAEALTSIIGDVRDVTALAAALHCASPEFVIHLAAQSLVRRSYADPAGTYATNVIGTVNVLEAIRASPGIRSAVIVTSDKCYENLGDGRRFRESDRLGGDDPYSSSKACAELVITAYRASFGDSLPPIVSVRAGNVIGGGDRSEDRLIPDLMRGIRSGVPTAIRSPGAVRPWQHVLEPLVGYLMAAERLSAGSLPPALNFGPDLESERSVAELADKFCRLWGASASWRSSEDIKVPEAQQLRLVSDLARDALGWRPRWDFAAALVATVSWYRAAEDAGDMRAVTAGQIRDYLSAWAVP